MTKNFCDRCGVECEKLFDIHIPLEKSGGKVSYQVERIEVCKKCNELNDKIVETLIEIRFSMYKNLFMKGANNEHR